MSDFKYKVGFLGAGYILQAHVQAVRALPGATLSAVCDTSIGRAQAAAQAHGIAQVHGSLDALLASDCEVVHVLLPPHLHADAAQRCLLAGKHVFLEKPMAPRLEDCMALADAAQRSGKQLGVNHNFLFTPAYERMRRDVKNQTVGRLDHLTVNWLLPLGQLRFGPFNNWMLAQPGNLFLEVGPHLAAFVVDLVGPLDNLQVLPSCPLVLPGGKTAFRHWQLVGQHGATAVSMTVSFAQGHPVRTVRVRGQAQAGDLDFGRDLYLATRSHSVSTMFDNLAVASHGAVALLQQGLGNFARALGGALNKSAARDPFAQSIALSVRAFYSGLSGTMDERLRPDFACRVMSLCSQAAATANAMVVSAGPAAAAPTAPAAPVPRILVVGGTGFIGKRLVALLVARGLGVRVLTRSVQSAQVELEGLAVDIVAGSHGDPATLERALDGIEVVYHLAKASGEKWADYVQGDVEPTAVLAQAAAKHGVRRFIYTGTIDSYDSASAQTVIGADTPLDPAIATRNHYGRSKAACEALLLELHRTQGLPLVILRPGIVIGAGTAPAHWGVGMFESDTRVRYWGDGQHQLPFVLVDDVANALVLALDKPGIEGQAFLVTDAPLLSAREYVAALARASGTRIQALATPLAVHFAKDAVKEIVKHAINHPNRRVPTLHDWQCRAHRARYDSAQTQRVLGWQPAGNKDALISSGVNAAVEWYLK